MTDENEESPGQPPRSRKRAAKTEAGEPAAPDARPAAKARSSRKKALPAHATPSEAGPDDAAEAAAMARADELVDQAGQRVGRFLSDASHRLRVIAARAQEEGEDIWAEAQHLRDKEHS